MVLDSFLSIVSETQVNQYRESESELGKKSAMQSAVRDKNY